jgi:GNAT superfamily N-acetyltransferase
MKVAWLSRLAVAPTYQRMGVATLLAIKAKELSRKARLPRADFLEVIRSFPASKSKQRVTGSKDFLTSAGFKVAPKPMISRPCTFLDSGSGIRIPQSAVKSYYYADLRNDD